jgi:uncharacterized membrane protein
MVGDPLTIQTGAMITDIAHTDQAEPNEVVEPTSPPTPRRWWHLDFAGVVGALVMIGLSLTPSLLPRPWLFEGLIAGVAAAIGYGLGALVGWAIRRFTSRRPRPRTVRIARWVLAGVGTLWFVAAIVAGGRWQNEVRVLVGEEKVPPGNYLFVALLTIVVGVLILAISRGIRRATRWINRQLERVVPRPVAQTAGVLAMAVLLYWLAAGAGFNAFTTWADTTYAVVNDGTPDGVVQPQSPLRSGSSASEVSWDSLGYQGRGFVGGGPTTSEITGITGKPAVEPIRVYVGVDSAPTARERADLAVKELERTGAFERPVLVVASATGTGWMDPQSVDSIEYMWGGDTAIATIQYSFLPSWISFLVDQERATDAGQALFEAVYARWSELPEDERPKLIAYGLSLGSFAGQSAFGSVQDMATRTDGALFMGTPNFTEPWGTVTKDRDAGTPEWQPIYREGATARFAASQGDLAKPAGPWPLPRVVYMQHASDPVVWWSPNLLLREPAWLQETRGPDVSTSTRWIPFVTFLQVTVDQFFGTAVPDGYGHNYGSTIVYAWENVVPSPDWTPAQSAKLQTLIDGYGGD